MSLEGSIGAGNENYSILRLNTNTQGAVVAIDISFNGKMVASGFEQGQIAFWDLTKKQCIKLVSNIFETPVLQIKFISADNNLLASDNEGNLQLLKLKKNLLSYTTESKILIANASASIS